MNPKKISDLMLERYLLNELDDDVKREIDAQLKIDTKLQSRIKSLQKSTDEILIKYKPGYMAAEIHKKMSMAARQKSLSEPETGYVLEKIAEYVRLWFGGKRNFLPTMLTAVATMVILVLVLPIGEEMNQPGVIEVAEVTRLKGEVKKLFVFRKQQNEIQMLSTGAEAKKGDLLQIVYFADREAFGMIFSLDGNGQVTVHFPEISQEKEQTFEKLETNKKVQLPTAYELDDAPNYEHFFLIISDKQERIKDVLSAINDQVASGAYKMNNTINPGSGMEVESLLIKKTGK